MNFLDAVLLLYFAMFLFIFSITLNNSKIIIARMLLLTPITLLLLMITFQIIYITAAQLYKVCRKNLKFPCTWLRDTVFTTETMGDHNALVGSQTATEPLIQPTSTVISFGAESDFDDN
jgi:uncharacterized protein YqhQ